jgi:hypothetical protein
VRLAGYCILFCDRDVNGPAFDLSSFPGLELMAELFLAVALAGRVLLGVFCDIDEIEGRGLDALAGQFTC